MKANFKSIDGTLYYATGVVIKSTSSGTIYEDGEGNELVDSQGKPLISISFDDRTQEADIVIDTGVRITYGKEARKRDIKGVKEIATRHAKSPEGRHTAWKNAKRELNNK